MRKIISIIVCAFFVLGVIPAQAAEHKTWTFLIFMNGNNNLERFSVKNMKQLEMVGSNDQVNIVVQWARYSQHKVVRLLVKKGTKSDSLASPVIQDLGQVDMGDYRNLEDFIKWGVENYPADHYFVDVWNHGSGWHATKNAANAVHRYDISWDDNTGHSITTEQLGEVMQHAAQLIGHKVDIYGSDACLMAMAEVAGEMGDSVRYFVGSQELEPGDGWPYDALMRRWEALENATGADISKILVEEYMNYYNKINNRSATFSAFDLEKFSALNAALGQFGIELRALDAKDKNAVLVAAESSTHFTGSADYVDLVDFTRHVALLDLHRLSVESIQNVQQAANEFVIAYGAGSAHKNATGLSIWIPEEYKFDAHADRYMNLVFSKESKWGDTLHSLIKRS